MKVRLSMKSRLPNGLRKMPGRTLLVALAAGAALTLAACSSSSSTTAGGTDAQGSAPTSASVTAPPQATVTAPIPPPGGNGDVNQTVETQEVSVNAPVALSSTATVAQGVDVSLASIEGTTADAVGPGEIAGPAVAVTVQVSNDTTESVPLDGYSVSLTDSDGQVAIPTTGGSASPLAGELAPGQSATGVYVFTVAQDKRSSVSISVNDAREATTVVFTGSAA
jgi:hypothetical protein